MLKPLDHNRRVEAERIGVLPSSVANTFTLYGMPHSGTLDCLGLRIAPNLPACLDVMMLCIPLDWFEAPSTTDWTNHPWDGAMEVGTGLLLSETDLTDVIQLFDQWAGVFAWRSHPDRVHITQRIFEPVQFQSIELDLQPYIAETGSADKLYRYRVEQCPQSFEVTAAFLAIRRSLTIPIGKNLGSLDLAAFTRAQLADPKFDPYYGNGVGIITLNEAGLDELVKILRVEEQSGDWGVDTSH